MIVLVRLKLGAHAEAVDAEIEVVADGTFYKRLPGDISMAIIARVLNLHTNVDKRNDSTTSRARPPQKSSNERTGVVGLTFAASVGSFFFKSARTRQCHSEGLSLGTSSISAATCVVNCIRAC